MDYLLYQNTTWDKTDIKCQRCGDSILREMYKQTGRKTDHVCCARTGCTWTEYHSDWIITQDNKRK